MGRGGSAIRAVRGCGQWRGRRDSERGVKRGDRVAGSKARTRCESAAFEGVKYSNKEPGLATYVWNIYIYADWRNREEAT